MHAKLSQGAQSCTTNVLHLVFLAFLLFATFAVNGFILKIFKIKYNEEAASYSFYRSFPGCMF
jgi:hypothetical protein